MKQIAETLNGMWGNVVITIAWGLCFALFIGIIKRAIFVITIFKNDLYFNSEGKWVTKDGEIYKPWDHGERIER